MIKRLLLVASTDKRLEELVSNSRLTRGLVSRFVAGTTLQEAVAVTRELRAEGIDVSLDLLGETVDDLAESATATKAYIDAVRAIAENSLGATVSVKLSQLGIGLDSAAAPAT
jgi:proline dehydrogenase